MIDLDFSVKKSIEPDEAWLLRVDDWLEVTETLFLGDVVFSVDGMNFGVKNNYILAVADTLLTASDALVFYEEDIQIGYPEQPQNLLFQRQGKQAIISLVSNGETQQEASADLLVMCREIGKFSRRVIWRLFQEYPKLMNNQKLFATRCRHADLHLYYYALINNPLLCRSLF